MTEVAESRYKGDITAGALKVAESRVIADLLLREVDAAGWKDAIEERNVLQARSPKTAKRLTLLSRGRLATMGPELWRLVRDGKGDVATHAVLAAAVKHSPLLGDFLDLVVREQYRLFAKALSNKLWDDYLHGCRERDPDTEVRATRDILPRSGGWVPGWNRQRWYRVLVLTDQVEGNAARSQKVQSPAGIEQLGDRRSSVEQMLEVVQHQQ